MPLTAGRLLYWRLLGLLMGLALNNIPAALVLAAGLGCSPLIVIRIRTGDYVRGLNEKLESAMGTVTNSYVASGDLIGAVQSSLHLLPAPLYGVFRQFYAENAAYRLGRGKKRYIGCAIGSTTGTGTIGAMCWCSANATGNYGMHFLALWHGLGEMRRVQMETDTTIRKQLGDYIVTVMIVLGAIPLMGAMMPDWYDMLTATPAGKITLAVVLAAVLATAVWDGAAISPGGRRVNRNDVITVCVVCCAALGWTFPFGAGGTRLSLR